MLCSGGGGNCYNEIDVLKGGTLAVYNWGTDEFVVGSNPNLRFVEPQRQGTRNSRLKEVVDTFTEMVGEYDNWENILLALSGGYDSRAVAGALSRRGIPYKAVTYIDADNTASDDYCIAKQLSSALKCAHDTIELHPETPLLYQKLFAIKEGANYLGMSFFVEFLESIASSNPPNSVMITGDGGDKVLPYLLPDIELRNEQEFLKFLYQRQSYFDPQIAADNFGLNRASIDEYLLGLVETYPGVGYADKYKQFLLAERSGIWLFEGEDRNRYFIKSETPFLDYRFYKCALQIPDDWKKGNSFYSSFIQSISPEANAIRLANSWMVPRYLSSATIQMILPLARKVMSLRNKAGSSHHTAPKFQMQNWAIDSLQRKFSNPASFSNTDWDICFGNKEYLSGLNRTQLNILITLSAIMNGSIDE